MTRRRPCPAAPGLLEGYAARFDDLFGSLAQRRGSAITWPGCWRRGIAYDADGFGWGGAGGRGAASGGAALAVLPVRIPVDAELVNARRPELLLADPATAPHDARMLVIDDSGAARTARSPRAWVISGWAGTARWDNRVVTFTTLWAAERLYYPRARGGQYPAWHFAKGKGDPAFRTKLAIDADLAIRARAAGFAFRAVAADSASGDHDGFRGELAVGGLPFVLGPETPPRTWAYKA